MTFDPVFERSVKLLSHFHPSFYMKVKEVIKKLLVTFFFFFKKVSDVIKKSLLTQFLLEGQ